MSKEILIELENPIMVTGNGDEAEINIISLEPPTEKSAHRCADIKSAFLSSIANLPTDGTEEAKKDKSEISGKDMIQMMYMSGTDMKKVIITAKEIIKAVGLLGGEKVVTQPLVDKMSPDDIEKCIGEYMANFLLKSALQEMNAD